MTTNFVDVLHNETMNSHYNNITNNRTETDKTSCPKTEQQCHS